MEYRNFKAKMSHLLLETYNKTREESRKYLEDMKHLSLRYPEFNLMWEEGK